MQVYSGVHADKTADIISSLMIYIDQNLKEVFHIMKSKFSKVTSVALAMAMCMPMTALAAGQQGTFDTSFDVYSPKLTIQVPVNADIQINPLSDSTQTDLTQFSVASNSIDIWNASVDLEKDQAIPINATVTATISSKKDEVITEYNNFTPSVTSPVKRINLNLTEAETATAIDVKDGATAAFDTEKKLDLTKYATKTAAVYTGARNKTAITQWGSSLSVDIAGPTTTDTTAGKTYSSDATKVKATVGSFAVTGVANASADWKADDITVAITYDIRASQTRNITTPTIATAPVFTSGTSATDLTIAVPNVGEATVTAMAAHNDESDYGDYFWEEDAYTVTYATASGNTTATIKIPKDDGGLAYLAGDDYKGEAQDFAIALSDGRIIVTTLTVN